MNGTLDLGDGHVLEFLGYEGQARVGANIKHKTKDGKDCEGFVSFEGRAWANYFPSKPAWKVESDEPLTLSPSILCRSCGDHGFVRNGKWERA